MTAAMEFCLLGPVVVRRDGQTIPVTHGKQQALLAALLLSAGRIVPVAELTEVLWGPGPPRWAMSSLQNYVMHLRRSLADVGRCRITTESGGYQIYVSRGELDVESFQTLLTDARTAGRDRAWQHTSTLLRRALSLWRGQPLCGVPSDLLALREIPRLAEMRFQALEGRIHADLHLGHHAEAIVDLEQLIGTHPMRERFHALLMIALYQNGQQARALAAYQAVRGELMRELGIEPGHDLRTLQQRILRGDPADAVLDYVAGGGRPPVAAVRACEQTAAPVPRQLPCPPGMFTGRVAELMMLNGLADIASSAGVASSAGRSLPICAITGTAGVGKTALAVHWGHQVADRFPDGQLYVNLRGYDPGQPVPAANALAGFLRALGVPGTDIPADADERAAQYRSLLAGRRMLVVLDNAGAVDQVRPLLPGARGCVAVVTSRDTLAGLVARDAAARLELDPLPSGDAVGLLRALIGERAETDPSATAVLAERCCRLPLALRVAAEAAVRHAAPLAALVDELAGPQRRLDLLEAGGDPRTAVRAVFSWSCRQLDAASGRAFRLLGLHPGPDLDCYAAAALTGSGPGQARHLLELLSRVHLIHPAGPGRYAMHDLLRGYARGLTVGQDARAALTRLFDYYLLATAAAVDTLIPVSRPRQPDVHQPSLAPVFSDPVAARAWVAAERANLVAVAEHTADRGWPGYTTRLAATLQRYLETGVHYQEAVTIYTCALRAARANGDRAAEAEALTRLGLIGAQQVRHHQTASVHAH